MLTRRLRRRLVRHHLVLATASVAATGLVAQLVPSAQLAFRWSIATAYVGLAVIGVSLAVGPLQVLRHRANPVSSDLRRDVGIWAGVLSILHFAVGWQVHMRHRYEYWFHAAEGTGTLVPRVDLFGFANHTGLAAVLVAALLMALSNDRSLRRLGVARWKGLQRWSYALFALVVAHGVAYQASERRAMPVVVLFVLMSGAVITVQLAGYRARRAAAGAA